MRPLQHRAHIDSIRTLFRSLDLEDPTRGYIFPKPVESKGFRTWKEGDLEKFRDRWPLGSLERTIFELGYHTCQRKSDLIRMKWSDIITLIADDGQTYEAIYVHAQHKTQETVVIPVDPDLREALDAYKAEMQEWLDMMEYKKLNEPSYAGVLAQYKGNSRRQAADDLILLSHLGYPLTPANYHNVMRPAFIAAGLPVFKKGMETHQHTFSGHGLRKGGMNGIAEGGGNVLQIMAISGHKSPKHVMHYVQDMEKQRAAIQAVQLRRASLEKRQADRAKAAGASSNIVSLKGERK